MKRRTAIALLVTLHWASPALTQDNPHGDLSVPCESCHSTSSWRVDLAAVRFDHSRTAFALRGQHHAVKCTQCHTSLRFVDVPARCASCHEDIHRGELGVACDRCHSPQSWLVVDMPRRHMQTRFPLTGMHLTASCEECHVTQQKHQYVGLSVECYSCHKMDYEQTFAPPHAASGIATDCVLCHSSQATTWGGSFDHATTGFVLLGAHAKAACGQCHAAGRFKSTPTTCYGCHQADYAGTQNPSHLAAGFGTDCSQCHSFTSLSWSGSFNHSQTGFMLVGAHATTACASCHAGGRFKGTPTDCYSCHQQDYAAATNPVHSPGAFPTMCSTCHTSSAWQPSTFNHTPYFPIAAGSAHSPGRWTTCADCHTDLANYAVFSCVNCHAHSQSLMDARHAGRSGYRYDSQACYSCHPRGNGG